MARHRVDAIAQRHDRQRLRRREHRMMAAARMVGVTVGHRGALDRARGIDPEVGGPHIEAVRMRFEPGLRSRHQTASFRARTRSATRSEEHTSELQSQMRVSYDGFCLKKTKQ